MDPLAIALIVIVLVVGLYAFFGRGMRSDSANARDGKFSDFTTSEGNYDSDGDGD